MDALNPKGPKTWAGVGRLVDLMSTIAAQGLTSRMPEPEAEAKASAAAGMADALSELLKAAPVREGPAGFKGNLFSRVRRLGMHSEPSPADPEMHSKA
jgi:hypothetical protein